MKKYTTIVLLLIMTFLLGGIFYQNKSINTEKESVKELSSVPKKGYFNIYQGPYKLGEAGLLNGVKMNLNTVNDTFTGTSYPSGELYRFEEHESGIEYYDDAYNTLTEEQKRYIKSIDTVEEVLDFYREFETPNCGEISIIENMFSVNTPTSDAPSPETNLGEDGLTEVRRFYCGIYLPTYFTLEETKVPNGYVKEKFLIPGFILAEYKILRRVDITPSTSPAPNIETLKPVESATDEPVVELVGIAVNSTFSNYMIRYGVVDRNSLTGLDIEAAADIWRRKAEADTCTSIRRLPSQKATDSNGTPYLSSNFPQSVMDVYMGMPEYPLCIDNYKGTVSLEATSYVNNVESLTTKINQTLEYKVVIKNTGDVDAIDNIIRSELPEGFIYVEGSASDNGVYQNGVIEWHIDRIEEGNNKELTYKAFAPKDSYTGQDYIGNASVYTFALDEPVQSNKTKVRLALQNPNTSAPIGFVIIVIAIAAAVVMMAIQYYKKQTQE